MVAYNDELVSIALEIVRYNALDQIHIGLDYFDASINRIAAWTIGARNTLKALLFALLEPATLLRHFEAKGDYTHRLALLENIKILPWQAVWNYYCMKNEIPVGMEFANIIDDYERKVLSKR